MIDVIDDLVTWLNARPEMAGTGVLVVRAPERTDYPQLRIQVISDIPTEALAGTTDHTHMRLQLSCLGRSYTDAHRLSAKLLKPVRIGGFFTGYRGSWGATEVQACLLVNSTDSETPPRGGDDTAVYGHILDYRIAIVRY